MKADPHDQFWYGHSRANQVHAFLWPVLDRVLELHDLQGKRVIDVGCGNGSTADYLTRKGLEVVGIDPSTSGIEQARGAFSGPLFEIGSAYDELAERFGQFSLAVSLEVVEHLYYPKKFARCLYRLCEPGGICLVSTPYHGYWKNLALALAGRWDRHHNPLHEGGHIKFFSIDQLEQLLREAGFENLRFHRVGRIPVIAKSVVAVCRRPR